MKESISTTKFSIKLMFFYLISISSLYILSPILNYINTNNVITIIIIIFFYITTTTLIIPNLIIKKLLKNKIITYNDIKIIKKNIIIGFLILLIILLTYKIPHYIIELNKLENIPSDTYICNHQITNLKINIFFQTIKTLFIFGSGIYYLISDINNQISSNNKKKYYIKRITYLIITISIYLFLSLFGAAMNIC